MKAIILQQFGGTGNFELADYASPQPKPNEVLIRIRATAFNPIDYQMRQGLNESKLLRSPILGRELSGEIVELGPGVQSFAVGDKVAAYVASIASNGTYAELISVPVPLIAKIPAQLSFEQAAAIPLVGLTALQCVRRIDLARHPSIFISGGAGGVGTILIKLLLSQGHHNLYTTAGSSKSTNHLLQIGLAKSHIIDYTKIGWQETVKTQNNQNLFDIVIDLVGGTMSEISAGLVEVFGIYVNVTALETEKARELLFNKATTVIHVANYAMTLKNSTGALDYYGHSLRELFSKIEQEVISPTEIQVVGNLSVDTVQAAHHLMEANQTFGKKLVMTIGN
ncbi:NADP-dependent oxidoreductase [Paraflavitalea sp. CAU 1676]|uniref:quinone oxidoreductase family protein n=1 Tax=Paraflavitalea sp. CAU 1676 TaxID=3032598 RepID=UPI0023DC6CBD|nr:NADP-dependent oxidoreductase [Paraflavitalea sp. CAU 1676]MDF2193205.1 NADP-dependent oxidoreductase [Paraflavitalea sp. CAU 1676]